MREVDDRQIGDGRPGPVTRWIQDEYQKVVHGLNPRYAEWLTYL